MRAATSTEAGADTGMGGVKPPQAAAVAAEEDDGSGSKRKRASRGESERADHVSRRHETARKRVCEALKNAKEIGAIGEGIVCLLTSQASVAYTCATPTLRPFTEADDGFKAALEGKLPGIGVRADTEKVLQTYKCPADAFKGLGVEKCRQMVRAMRGTNNVSFKKDAIPAHMQQYQNTHIDLGELIKDASAATKDKDGKDRTPHGEKGRFKTQESDPARLLDMASWKRGPAPQGEGKERFISFEELLEVKEGNLTKSQALATIAVLLEWVHEGHWTNPSSCKNLDSMFHAMVASDYFTRACAYGSKSQQPSFDEKIREAIINGMLFPVWTMKGCKWNAIGAHTTFPNIEKMNHLSEQIFENATLGAEPAKVPNPPLRNPFLADQAKGGWGTDGEGGEASSAGGVKSVGADGLPAAVVQVPTGTGGGVKSPKGPKGKMPAVPGVVGGGAPAIVTGVPLGAPVGAPAAPPAPAPAVAVAPVPAVQAVPLGDEAGKARAKVGDFEAKKMMSAKDRPPGGGVPPGAGR